MDKPEPYAGLLDGQAREPLAPVAALVGGVGAVCALLVAFGVHLSRDQVAAILGVVAAVGPLLVWAVGRRRVFSPATVARLLRR